MLQPWISKFIRDIILEKYGAIESQWVITLESFKPLNLIKITENDYHNFRGGSLADFIPKKRTCLV
jgi:hypothetical protein